MERDEAVEVGDTNDDGTSSSSQHVTFNLPLHENNYYNDKTALTQPQAQHYFTEFSTPSPNYYPSERLGRLHNIVRNHRGRQSGTKRGKRGANNIK